jgi:hypothetical protein
MSPTTGNSPTCPPQVAFACHVGEPTTALVKNHRPRSYRPGESTPSPFQSAMSGCPEAAGMRIVVDFGGTPIPE